MDVLQDTQAAPKSVSFADAFRFWLKLGFVSFGGPAGQIAIMQQELVQVAAAAGCARLSDINKTTVRAHFV